MITLSLKSSTLIKIYIRMVHLSSEYSYKKIMI